jgi:hypothetical protein
VSKDIDRELFQIFRTNKAPADIEQLCHAFIEKKINSLELEHIAELLFSIAVNKKLRIEVPWSLLTKRMKDVGVKALSMDKLRKLLYGLRTISTGKSVGSLNRFQREKLEFVSVVVSLVEAFGGVFTAQAVGNGLYGLQRLSSGHVEVRNLLASLVPRVKSCKEDLKAQEVGNALYGLQGMSSYAPEVRELLIALLPRVKSCKDLDAQAVGNALYGL